MITFKPNQRIIITAADYKDLPEDECLGTVTQVVEGTGKYASYLVKVNRRKHPLSFFGFELKEDKS